MTNTKLLQLIANSGLYEDDVIEIVRIFEILPDKRKIEIIDDWDNIADRIKKRREQTEREKEALLMKTIEKIERDLENYNKSLVGNNAKNDLKQLKQNT